MSLLNLTFEISFDSIFTKIYNFFFTIAININKKTHLNKTIYTIYILAYIFIFYHPTYNFNSKIINYIKI